MTNDTNRRRAALPALVALLVLMLAAAPGLAAPIAGDEEEKVQRRIEREIRVMQGGQCEDGDEDCHGYVWVMDDDSESPDGPRVQVLPLHGMMQRGWLGVHLTPLNPELLDHFGVAADGGVLVSRVEKESPADEAGVRVGDVITAVDGREIGDSVSLQVEIGRHEEGDRVRVEVWRDGRALDLDVTIGQRPRSQFDISPMLFSPEHGSRYLFRMDPEALADAEKRLAEVLKDKDFASRFHGTPIDEQQLRERLREVEQRLAELQEQLRALSEEND